MQNMKRFSKFLVLALVLTLVFSLAGCASYDTAEEDTAIISASTALSMLNDDNVVVIDAQRTSVYNREHLTGALSISRTDIVANDPFANMLAPKTQIESVLSNVGVSNDSSIIIYDNNDNMDSARLWWTLMAYGHEDVKVISGGLNALKAAGGEFTSEKPVISKTNYVAQAKDESIIADISDVMAQLNDPQENVAILDVRSLEEYNQGAIPASVNIDYITNNYSDGTYKDAQDIKIMYIEKGLTPEKTTIMYCKTSIRAAQTYLALYNSGYRNIKVYDGAWLEYCADESRPVQVPSGNKVEFTQQDNS